MNSLIFNSYDVNFEGDLRPSTDEESCYQRLFTVNNLIKSTAAMLGNVFPQTKVLVVDNRHVLQEPGKIATRKEEPLMLKIVCFAGK